MQTVTHTQYITVQPKSPEPDMRHRQTHRHTQSLRAQSPTRVWRKTLFEVGLGCITVVFCALCVLLDGEQGEPSASKDSDTSTTEGKSTDPACPGIRQILERHRCRLCPPQTRPPVLVHARCTISLGLRGLIHLRARSGCCSPDVLLFIVSKGKQRSCL